MMKFMSEVLLLASMLLTGSLFAEGEFKILGSTFVYEFSPKMFKILTNRDAISNGLIQAIPEIRPECLLQTSPVKMPFPGQLNVAVKYEVDSDMLVPFDRLSAGLPLAEIEVSYSMHGENRWASKMLRTSDVPGARILAEFESKKSGRGAYTYGRTHSERKLNVDVITVPDSAEDIVVSICQVWSNTDLKINAIEISLTKDSDE